MRKLVEAWQKSELTDVTAKVVIYEAFVEGKLEGPKHLALTVLPVMLIFPKVFNRARLTSPKKLCWPPSPLSEGFRQFP